MRGMIPCPLLTEPEGRARLSAFYRSELVENVMPFWLRHGFDREHGGLSGAPKFPQCAVFELLWRQARRSKNADMKNIGGRYGGAITAAQARLADVEAELQAAYARWEALEAR